MSVLTHRFLACDFCSDSEFIPPRRAFDAYSLREQAENADWIAVLVDAQVADKCPACQEAGRG